MKDLFKFTSLISIWLSIGEKHAPDIVEKRWVSKVAISNKTEKISRANL